MADSHETKVLQLIAATFQLPLASLNRQSSRESIPAWDSFASLHLASEIEAAFDVAFTVDDISELKSVDAILQMLAAKGAR
ncbi:MAG: acyl carrier protein [Myxococcaceae bacterium]|nr:acyl carrier protein [Myxococcaceae bacterium]